MKTLTVELDANALTTPVDLQVPPGLYVVTAFAAGSVTPDPADATPRTLEIISGLTTGLVGSTVVLPSYAGGGSLPIAAVLQMHQVRSGCTPSDRVFLQLASGAYVGIGSLALTLTICFAEILTR
jgi:hypothetical protein